MNLTRKTDEELEQLLICIVEEMIKRSADKCIVAC